jgi:hypothetical protein
VEIGVVVVSEPSEAIFNETASLPLLMTSSLPWESTPSPMPVAKAMGRGRAVLFCTRAPVNELAVKVSTEFVVTANRYLPSGSTANSVPLGSVGRLKVNGTKAPVGLVIEYPAIVPTASITYTNLLSTVAMLSAALPLGRVKVELGIDVKELSLLTDSPVIVLEAPYMKAKGVAPPVPPPVVPMLRVVPVDCPLLHELISIWSTTTEARRRLDLLNKIFSMNSLSLRTSSILAELKATLQAKRADGYLRKGVSQCEPASISILAT